MLRVFLLLTLLANVLAGAETLADSARGLARKILANLGPGEALKLAVRNDSALPPAEAAAVRQALEAELPGRGSSAAAASVTVTLSEDSEGLLWIVEVARAGKRDAVVMERPRGQSASRASASAGVAIVKETIWEQDAPILDVAVGGETMAVLQPSGVLFYTRQDGAWTLRKPIVISASKRWPRDLRGRVVLDGDAVSVFLPGLSCSGPVRPEPLLECKEADTEWPGAPVGALMRAGSNAFTTPGVEPFYSAAAVGQGWLTAQVDGAAQLRDGALRPVAAFAGWGSNVAAIENRCGSRVLATRASESDEPDEVQAFEIADRQPVAVSAPVDFAGPVTALWQAADRSTAVAISRSIKTGRYAAFSLTIPCSR